MRSILFSVLILLSCANMAYAQDATIVTDYTKVELGEDGKTVTGYKGKHTATFKVNGSVLIESKTNSVHVGNKLETIAIVSSWIGAQVYIDGKLVGEMGTYENRITSIQLQVEPGTHTLEILWQDPMKKNKEHWYEKEHLFTDGCTIEVSSFLFMDQYRWLDK